VISLYILQHHSASGKLTQLPVPKYTANKSETWAPSSPTATKDEIQGLQYRRQSPSLNDSIVKGNPKAISGHESNKLKRFLVIDQSLGRANVELMLLKMLSAVSLWTTVMAMMGDSDDEKVTKEIKARRPLISD
jgi:hypothetical protein